MSLAIIKTGGKQYIVKPGDSLKVEKLQAEIGETVEFDTLLKADQASVELGTPMLASKVTGQVTQVGKSAKVTGIKYKPKTRQATKFGHRQTYSQVKIQSI